jgi:RNA polymerase sigma factor (sigma-70 family)
MQHDDFTSWTPEHCKRIIHEYQHTKNKELFNLLLARYDKYLVKLAWHYQKHFISVPLEDLYHSAIVGFGEFLVQFKQQAPSRLIMAVIKAYVKTEIEARYRSKQEYEISNFKSNNEDEHSLDDIMDAHSILGSSFLSEKEKNLLMLRFEENMTFREVGKKFGITEQGAWQRFKKIVGKIRRVMRKEER